MRWTWRSVRARSTGMLVVGLGLLGIAGYYGLLTELFDKSSWSPR